MIHVRPIDLEALQWQQKTLPKMQWPYSSRRRLWTLWPQQCDSDECTSAFRYWRALRVRKTNSPCVYALMSVSLCVCSLSPEHVYKSQLNHMFENFFYLLHNCSSSSCLLHCHLIYNFPSQSHLSLMTQCLGLFNSSVPANRISFKLPVILTCAPLSLLS